MNHTRSQSGMVAFLLLVLTTLSGSLFLVSYTQTTNYGKHREALTFKRGLLRAHQNLISYTVNYPYLYGPRGAGLGHLPCPDTDTRSPLELDAWIVKSGPNPPCGWHSDTSGFLPTHISYPRHRYLLDAAVDESILYDVADQIVNNPPNRIANPSSYISAKDSTLSLATLRQPLFRSGNNDQQGFNSIITPVSMLLATKPAVAAWLVERVVQLKSITCVLQGIDRNLSKFEVIEAKSDLNDLDSLISADACHINLKLARSCEAPVVLQPLWNDYIAIPDRPFVSSQEQELLEQSMMLILADRSPGAFRCDIPIHEQLLVEGVPANIHWFFRNQWSSWVRVDVDDSCISSIPEQCVFSKIQRTSSLETPIVAKWSAL